MSAGAGGASLGSIVMVWGNHTVHESPAAAAPPDAESAEWLRGLADSGPQREAALARLHGLLVRIARGEVARRGPRLAISGPELDDLAYQAAADALLAVTRKLGQFRGESRFTAWACKFVILEVSAKLGRHAARPTLTSPVRSRRGECPGDGLARPSHPRRRSLRVLTELLGHPSRATPLTEPPGGRGDSLLDLLDLLDARSLRWLQRRHEQGVAACRADAATAHYPAHPGLPGRQAASGRRRRRSASRAADSRDLTVPAGTPRSVAILVMLSSWR